MIDENLKRRHLSTGQRAKLANEALPLLEAEARQRMIVGKAVDPGADLPQGSDTEPKPKRAARSRDKAAKATGTSGRAVAQYKRLAEQAPDLAADMPFSTIPETPDLLAFSACWNRFAAF